MLDETFKRPKIFFQENHLVIMVKMISTLTIPILDQILHEFIKLLALKHELFYKHLLLCCLSHLELQAQINNLQTEFNSSRDKIPTLMEIRTKEG